MELEPDIQFIKEAIDEMNIESIVDTMIRGHVLNIAGEDMDLNAIIRSVSVSDTDDINIRKANIVIDLLVRVKPELKLRSVDHILLYPSYERKKHES
jgi:hypothetical protein